MDETTFGGRVRTRRVFGLRMSQRVFAAVAGVDPMTLSKVEAGRAAPWDEPTIRRVADLLGDDAEDLLALAHQWTPPAPEALAPLSAAPATRPRRCIRCGRDMTWATGQAIYHETASGGLICADHLNHVRDYWMHDLLAPRARPSREED